jgi:hypothetical protein
MSEDEIDSVEEKDTLDFDQFWASHVADPKANLQKRVKILGEYYTLTVDIPFELLIQAMATDSNDIEGMSMLVDELYGEGVLQTWLDKGMSLAQLPIIMAWSIARIQGRDLTFEQVAEQLQEFLGGKGKTSSKRTGPPLNRASRRATARALKK